MMSSGKTYLGATVTPVDAACCPPSSRWRGRLALAVVLLVGGGLRFNGITDVGIRFNDEACYVADARLWHRCARVMTDPGGIRDVVAGDGASFRRRLSEAGVDFSQRYLKPCQGYTFLGAAAMFVVGDDPSALLVLNALCGTLSVLVVYCLGVVLFGRPVALGAAFLLAVSPYHLLYSRSALSDATALLFVSVGILCWALGSTGRWSWRRGYGAAGAALGVATLCHFRSADVPWMLLLAEILIVVWPTPGAPPARVRWVQTGERWVWLGLGFAVPILCIEGVFRAIRLGDVLSATFGATPTLFEAVVFWADFIKHRVWVIGSAILNPEVPGAYAAYFLHWYGVAATAMALVGVAVSLRAKGAAKCAGVLVLTSLGILLFQRHLVARAMSVALPFVSLCTAVGIAWAVTLVARRRRSLSVVLSVVAIGLVSVPSMRHCLGLGQKRSDLEAVCRYVERRGGTVAVPDYKKYWLYLQDTGVPVIRGEAFRMTGPPDRVIERLGRAGVRWLITDPQYWHYGARNPVYQWWRDVDEYLAERASPVLQLAHMNDFRWEFLAEGQGLRALDDMTRGNGGSLRVYDLRAVRQRPTNMEPRVPPSGQTASAIPVQDG